MILDLEMHFRGVRMKTFMDKLFETMIRKLIAGIAKYLDKVHVEFGIVALAHNLLKVAGIRLATFL
ncbi:hypothetical protein [Paenibacillus senegalensis]|uniref:hypothetical protein n=1 Tax=Paenibacillus senegalensis TaxID=1465766 RepID=UPI0002881C07|nr:hypothetical protein [Paenibacillus senegalensis]